MDLGFIGKVAMVAASSKGLGFGIAQELAREGASVSIGSRTQADIENAAAKLHDETGASVLATVMDATSADSIQNWIQRTLDEYGGVDALVVNAGGPPPGQFDDFSDDDWQNAFELNVMSGVRMIRGVLPSMRERGGGSILTVTSCSVKEPIDILILSNVMRSGTTGLVKSLSLATRAGQHPGQQPHARTHGHRPGPFRRCLSVPKAGHHPGGATGKQPSFLAVETLRHHRGVWQGRRIPALRCGQLHHWL